MRDRLNRKAEDEIKQARYDGDFKKLKGHGQPLSKEYLEGDTLDGILKNTNYLPPWLAFQHEIRDDIGWLIDRMPNMTEDIVNIEIDEINEKIKRFNRMCPAPVFQKMRLFRNTIEQQYKRWE